MIVFRFAGFAAGFSKRMTGERLGVRIVPPLWFYVKRRANGGSVAATSSEKSDLYLKIWTCFRVKYFTRSEYTALCVSCYNN